MPNRTDFYNYLPLTETTTYILMALAEPLHGYGVMQKVETLSKGTLNLGPGTLYGVLNNLENDRLIVKLREEERRKVYALTNRGRSILEAQISRLELMTRAARKLIRKA